MKLLVLDIFAVDDDAARARLYRKMCQLDDAIVEAPVRSAADLMVKVRRLIRWHRSLSELEHPDEFGARLAAAIERDLGMLDGSD